VGSQRDRFCDACRMRGVNVREGRGADLAGRRSRKSLGVKSDFSAGSGGSEQFSGARFRRSVKACATANSTLEFLAFVLRGRSSMSIFDERNRRLS
jgi:hypothetical protein